MLYGQRSQLWWDLPLINSFQLLQAIYNISDADYKKRLDFFVEALDMSDFLNRPVRQLSLGQRMKGDIVATLLHSPPVLFLDEPTIGLDVVAKDRIQQFLRMINKEEKVTILLTSHNMDDIEKLCDRVILIDNGKVMFDGSQDQLKNLVTQNKTLVVDVAYEDIGKSTTPAPDSVENNQFFFNITDDGLIPELLQTLSQQVRILKIEILETSIENIIKELYVTKSYQ